MEGTWCGRGKNCVWCVSSIFGERPEGRTETSFVPGGCLVKPVFLGSSWDVDLQGVWTQPKPTGANGREKMAAWLRVALKKAALATGPARLVLRHHLFHRPVSKGNQMSELLEWFCKSVLSVMHQNNSLQQGQHSFSAYSLFLVWQLFENLICCTCQDW